MPNEQHEPFCEAFEPERTDPVGLPCHCSEETAAYRSTQDRSVDPYLQYHFGSGTWDMDLWLERANNHDGLCPAVTMDAEEACLCILIEQVRDAEKQKLIGWFAAWIDLPAA